MAGQICEQIITGRNYDYQKALDIIQNEEYLENSDFAKSVQIIRRQGKVLQSIENFEERVANSNHEKFGDLGEVHRVKRALFPEFASFNTSNVNITTTPFMLAATGLVSLIALFVVNRTPGLVPSTSPQQGKF